MTGTQRQTVTDPYRDTDWANQGRCRSHNNPDLWFPVSYERDRAQVEEAKAECRQCPVIEACTEYAMAKDTFQAEGIWGGLTPHQRRPRGQKPIEHGTPGGYMAHMRRRERACDPCRNANRDAVARARAAKGRAA